MVVPRVHVSVVLGNRPFSRARVLLQIREGFRCQLLKEREAMNKQAAERRRVALEDLAGEERLLCEPVRFHAGVETRREHRLAPAPATKECM